MQFFFRVALCLATVFSATAFLGSNAEEPASIKIEIVGATGADKESGEVLAALQKLMGGLARSDFDLVGNCLSPDVVVLEERSHELIYGKKAVLDRVRANMLGSKEKSPVKHITIRDPFIDVKGEGAMVSFEASKELQDGRKFESLCSEVYERKDGQWLVLKFRSNWKPSR
jgi:hypothetical protein